jgi:hypothetical protein
MLGMRIPQCKRPLSDFCLDLAIIIFSLFLEILLLYAIFSHPAGGRTTSMALLVKFLGIASFPFLFFLFENRVGSNSQGYSRSLSYLFKLSIIGVLFCLIALKNYSHSTPGIMMLGYIIQWIIVLRYGYVLYRNRNKSA